MDAVIADDDAELARRDPALPGLATLLDDDAFASALRSAAPDAGLETAHASYARYKPGTSCLVSYRLDVGGAEVDAYARAHPLDDLAKLEPARGRADTSGPPWRTPVLLAELGIAVYPFPHDRRLRSLAGLADPGRRRALLARALPERPDLWEAGLRRLRYKPERRFVAELTADTGARALLKAYDDGDYRGASRNAKVFVSRGSLRVAQRLGRSPGRRVLVTEWLPGRELMEGLAGEAPDLDATAMAGAALAELHGQRPHRPGHHTSQGEAETVHEAAGAVGAVCPALAERARRLAVAIAAELAATAFAAVTIHGDFSADQVLVGDGTAAIVDLDHAVRSDPRTDLGSFTARLERDVLAGKLSSGRANAATAALLDGYRDRARGEFDGVKRGTGWIRPHTAARLLRLAPEPFRYREQDWHDGVEALLTRVQAILDGD